MITSCDRIDWKQWHQERRQCTEMRWTTFHVATVLGVGRYGPTRIDRLLVHCGESIPCPYHDTYLET